MLYLSTIVVIMPSSRVFRENLYINAETQEAQE